MAHSSDPLNEFLDRNAKFRAGPADKEPLGERRVECEKHGSYIANGVRYFGKREIWTKCPDCESERESAERAAKAAQIAHEKQLQLNALIEQAAIPERFIGRTFETFKAATPAQMQALAVVRKFADEFEHNYRTGRGLILSGMPGTGKSHLAGAVLQAILPAHCGLYITCLGLIRMVRATWRRDNARSETEVMNTLTRVPLLVIDEIGVQYGTEGEQTILFDVLDARYRSMQPTILLTNQDKAGLKTFLGDRTYDRLTETCRWVAFDWESYRPKARTEAA